VEGRVRFDLFARYIALPGLYWVFTDKFTGKLANIIDLWIFMDNITDMSFDLKTMTITPDFLKSIAAIDEFKGAWQALGSLAPERLSSLRRVATIESIGSSTRIEGSKLSDSDVERLLSNLEIKKFTSRDEQEVAGYAEAMDLVFGGYDAISLTENHIKQLHGGLLKYSEKDARHRGEYKTNSNHVSAFDAEGKEVGIVFETATPFDTPRLMTELVGWAQEALETKEIHSLLIIAVFIVVFLEIHPFQDGNGRLSRILTTLLLLRAGYHYVPYSSLESVIEQHKEGYYLALRQTQGTIRSQDPNWTPWIGYFLTALVRQKDRLKTKVERERILVGSLPKLSLDILELAKAHGRVNVREMVAMTGANRNTVKDHLQKLVAANHLAKHGTGRGTWYARP